MADPQEPETSKPESGPEPVLIPFRERIGAEEAAKLHQRLDELLDSKGQAFLIMLNGDTQLVNDAYNNVCDRCVSDAMLFIMQNALEGSRITAEAVAKMQGHKHPPKQQPRTRRPGLEL